MFKVSVAILSVVAISPIILFGLAIRDNRKFVRDDIQELKYRVEQLERFKQGYPIDESLMRLAKLVDPSHNLIEWRDKKLEEKYMWLSQPFYKQYGVTIPVTCYSELFSITHKN
jgi:hypothetical protein